MTNSKGKEKRNKEEWEESLEFGMIKAENMMKRYPKDYDYIGDYLTKMIPRLKSFIRQVILKARKEEREKVIEEIDRILRTHQPKKYGECYLFEALKKLKIKLNK